MSKLDDLLLLNLASLLLIGAVLLFPNSPARTALALPLVLLSPGYALTSALYARRTDLSTIERLALSLGFSLALVPVIGLLLNFLPGGIRLGTILISLIGFIAACSVFAVHARGRLSQQERFSIDLTPLLRQFRAAPWPQLALACGVVAATAVVSWHARSASPGETFTEFYVLNSEGKAENYPDRAVVGRPIEVTLGIINHEPHQSSYKITIQAGGQTLRVVDPVILGTGATWEQRVSFSLLRPNHQEEVDFLVFKNGNPIPYRHLHLWVNVLATPEEQ